MTRDRRPVLILTIGLALLSGLLVGPPSHAFPDGDEGFVPLFNGRNLDGWVVHNGDRSAWAVEDGLLVGRKGGGWLMSKATYSDFELRLEYKMPKKGNSGVALRSPIEGDPSRTGMEVQLLDDAGYQGLMSTQVTGAIYDVVGPMTTEAVKTVGQWNRMTIIAQGARVTIELNGVRVQNVDLDAPLIRAKANSDPSMGHPGLLRHEGSIGLQALQ